MIDYGKREYRNEVMSLFKSAFPLQSGMETNYFFSEVYQEENCLTLVENGRILAAMHRFPINILFNGRYLKSSVITHVAVDNRYRHQGLMHRLMYQQLSILEHTELVSLALSANESDLSEFGFEPVYLRNVYEVTRNQTMNPMSNEGISFRFRSNDMVQLYARFMQRFNGFVVRDKKDMESLVKKCQALNGKVIFYYDGNNQLQGYCAYHVNGLAVIMDEVVYMDSIALAKMVNYALMERHYIEINVSNHEDLLRIFPNAKLKNTIYAGLRINDYDLYNRLYNCNVNSVSEALQLSHKGMHCLLHF